MKPYYQDDHATIYYGDCRELTVSADAVVTDPPYGTGDLMGGYGRRGVTIANDSDLSAWAEFWNMFSSGWSGWAMVFFAASREENMAQTTMGSWRGTLVWHKRRPGMGYTIRYTHEQIAVLEVGKPPRPRRPIMSVIDCPHVPCPSHPHRKPVDLLQTLVAWVPGDTVLDPFMGSGTTLVAAKNLGRKAIGIEIEERYCEIAAERLSQGVLPLGGAA